MTLHDLVKAARKLANAVEHDMNGTMGKGGNGGLLSDTTLRAAHEVQAILSRPDQRHGDEIAIDLFAQAMKEKMAKKRTGGLDIWRDNEKCSQKSLSQALAHHVQKGDPIDVANFAMMLHQRGETIALDFKPIGVRRTGCGSSMTDEQLAAARAKRPALLSCCPERKMISVYATPLAAQMIGNSNFGVGFDIEAGWQIVPKEPNPAMIEAGLKTTGMPKNTYRDMLAAARGETTDEDAWL